MSNNAIKKLKIHHLQRLRNIELEFPAVGVTAIVGVNGSGKSTLLRALACVYQPQRNIELVQEDYRPSRYFIGYDGNSWAGSLYEVWVDGHDDSRLFKKEDAAWEPLPITRLHRYVKFIGIGDAVPHIEKDLGADSLNYLSSEFWEAKDAKLPMFLRKVGETLNRTYSAAGIATKETGLLKRFMYAGLEDRTYGRLTYPSHYMGAGEQKIFEVVREVLQAPKGAMILIEEPEVSLHNKAMNDLLVFLDEQAKKKDLQIVISTHWLGIKTWSNKIAFFTLHVDPTSDIVTCAKGFNPVDQIAISGELSDLKKLTIWVEDELARSIVDHLANKLGLKKFVKKIGVAYSANNLFSVAAGLVIDREVVDDVLIVGDGDVATSHEAKSGVLRRLIDIVEGDVPVDGPSAWVENRRLAAVGLVSEFSSPDNKNPEEFFLAVARDLVHSGGAPDWLRSDVADIDAMRPPPSAKKAFYDLARTKSDSDIPAQVTQELGRLHARLIQTVAESKQWPAYVQPVKDRLLSMCRAHRLIEVESDGSDLAGSVEGGPMSVTEVV